MMPQFFTRGEEIVGTSPACVLVHDAYALPMTSGLDPASIAHTASGAGKWQLNGDHQWIDCSTGNNTAESAVVGLGLVGFMTI